MRRVIPFQDHLPQASPTNSAGNIRNILLGVTLIVLHVASIVVALRYF